MESLENEEFKIQTKDDILSYFNSRNVGHRIFPAKSGAPEIIECRAAFLFLEIDSATLFKDIFKEDKIYFAFLTYAVNKSFLERISTELIKDPVFNVDTSVYNIYLNFIEKGGVVKQDFFEKESSCFYDDNNIDFQDAYKRFLLPRHLTSIHHGRQEKTESFMKLRFEFPQFENKGLYTKLNNNFLDITVNKETALLKKFTDLKINFKILIFSLDNQSSCLSHFFGYFKYNVFFSKESMANYIAKYLINLLFMFTHTSEILLDYFQNLGLFVKKKDGSGYSAVFPFKQESSKIFLLLDFNRRYYLFDRLNEIKSKNESYKKNAASYKFVLLKSRFSNEQQYYNSGLFLERIDDTILKLLSNNEKRDSKRKSSSFDFTEIYEQSMQEGFKTQNLFSQGDSDKYFISKFRSKKFQKFKEDLFFHDLITKVLSYYSEAIGHNSGSEHSSDELLYVFDQLQSFFEDSISKSIIKHVTFEGFTSIDVISNEDGMVDLHCYKGRKQNRNLNKFLGKIFDCGLSIVNKFFNLNEGFFHKHLSILGFSYNFNHTNTVETVPTEIDSSLRNKLRVFDVLFLKSWAITLAKLTMILWKIKFQLFRKFCFDKKADTNKDTVWYYDFDLGSLVRNDILKIIQEYFEYYSTSLPDYGLFSQNLSEFVKKKYNMIDNICQHFANKSLDILLKENITDYTILHFKYNALVERQIIPKFDKILEPYFIHIDSLYEQYVNYWSDKQSFINQEMNKCKRFKAKARKTINPSTTEEVHVFPNKNSTRIGVSTTQCDDFEPRSTNLRVTTKSSNKNVLEDEMKDSNDNMGRPNINKNVSNQELENLIYDLSQAGNDKIYWYLIKSEDSRLSRMTTENELTDLNTQSKDKNEDTNYYYNLSYLHNLIYFYLYRLNHKLLEDTILNRVAQDRKEHKNHKEDTTFFKNDKNEDENYLSSFKSIIRNFYLTRSIISKAKNMCLGYYDYVLKNNEKLRNDINNLKEKQNLDVKVKSNCNVRIGWLTSNLKSFD